MKSDQPDPAPLYRGGVIILLVGVALTSIGCGAGAKEPEAMVTRSELRMVEVKNVAVEDVVLAVPLRGDTRTAGECEPRRTLGDEVHVRMRWAVGDQVVRTVMVTLDEEGRPRTYNDLRGGLTNVRSMGSSMPGTGIHITFPTRAAVIQNQGGDGSGHYRVPFEDALRAVSLDGPEDIIEDLLERCG